MKRQFTRRGFVKATLAGGAGLVLRRAAAPILVPETGAACAVLVLATVAVATVWITHYCKQRWLVVRHAPETEGDPATYECIDCGAYAQYRRQGDLACLGKYSQQAPCIADAAHLTAVAATNPPAILPCAPITPAKAGSRLNLNHSSDLKQWNKLATITPTATSAGWMVVTPADYAKLSADWLAEAASRGMTLVQHDWQAEGHGFFCETEEA